MSVEELQKRYDYLDSEINKALEKCNFIRVGLLAREKKSILIEWEKAYYQEKNMGEWKPDSFLP